MLEYVLLFFNLSKKKKKEEEYMLFFNFSLELDVASCFLFIALVLAIIEQ